MQNEQICYNCFQARDSLDGPCPYCGFDLAENEKKYPVALRAGTVLNDRYIVGRVLGQGGFGITYLAWDTQLEAKVAIKEFMPGELATRVEGTTVSVLSADRSEDFTYGAERFQEEARTLAKFIGNPNIAAVTSYFDENDTSYFVMDYIEGISFKTYIANHGGKVSVEDTLNVMIPVLRALTAVHQEGFIHRDVTPDNIYITKDGMVKLLDFGSARYSIGDKSKSLDVILKVGYAPKEQYIRRSRQGPYTDVYSCAACFYAALTGFLPPEALERLDRDELVPVSQCGVDIPEYLDKAILKGLAVQPEDRFQSAEEFLNAIESQQVVEVPRAGAAQPAAPAKKKLNPVLIGGVAAAVLIFHSFLYQTSQTLFKALEHCCKTLGLSLVFFYGLNEIVYRLSHLLWGNPTNLNDAALLTQLTAAPRMMAIVVIFLAPFLEELLLRGSVLSSLAVCGEMKRGLRIPFMVVVSGLMFALIHMNPQQTVYQFFFGCALAYVTIRFGSIVPAIIMHALNNAIGVVLSVPAVDGALSGWINGIFASGWGLGVFIAVSAALAVMAALVIRFVGRRFGGLEPESPEPHTGKTEDFENYADDGGTLAGTIMFIVGAVICLIMWVSRLVTGLGA